MTRKSKREIERAVKDLGDDGDDGDDGGPYGPGIVYETEDGYTDLDGEPVPTDDDGKPLPPPFGARIVFPGESDSEDPDGGRVEP